MSVRLERINGEIAKSLALIIKEQNQDRNGVFFSVTQVDTSKDLSFAKVFVSVFGADKKTEVEALNKNKASLRHSLARMMSSIRTVPELRFVVDESLEYGKKIDKILEEIK